MSKLTILVTGGSAGYGAGIAEALSQAGHRLFITGRNAERLASVAAKTGAQAIVADVTSPTDWDRVVETILGETGRIDVLVNNAGAGGRIAPIDALSDAEITQTIALNLTSVLFGCRRVGAIMKRQTSGTIINISSVCAHYSWPGWTAYSAAKAGLDRVSKGLYTELREFGVRVTTLTPSWGATEFSSASNIEGHPTADPSINARCIQPLELGKVILDLVNLPSHLVIPEIKLLPTVQEIIPS